MAFAKPCASQVEKWHEEKPDGVHQVPVEAHHFNGGIVLGRNRATSRFPDQPDHAPNPNEDVDAVNTGHDVVEAEEQLHFASVNVPQLTDFVLSVSLRQISGPVLVF